MRNMILFAAVLFAGCGGSGDVKHEPGTTEGTTEGTPTEGTAPTGTETTPPTEGTPAEGTADAGGLTKEKLTAAKEQINAFNPWASSEAKLKELLGEPQKVEGDNYVWSVKDGDSCQVLTVQKMADSVGNVALETKACP